MARQRSPARDEAKKLYLDSKGTIKLVDIAAKLELTDVKIRKWKNLDKWDKELKGNVPLKEVKKKVERTIKKSTTKKNKANIKESIADEVKEVLENTELTDKQRLFCVLYVRCYNATKAYLKAYKCSYETAMSEGSKHLRNPKIREQIEKLKQESFNRAMLKEDAIVQRFIDIAFADITEYVQFGEDEKILYDKDGKARINEDGEIMTMKFNYVKLGESNQVDGSLINEVSEGRDGIKFKLHDKIKALQWLSDRMDLLPTATREKLELEKRKMILLENQADDLDEDIEYIIEDDADEEKEN